MGIATNQPDTESKPNPNPNYTTKQHAVVRIQLNIVTCFMCPDKSIRFNVIAPFFTTFSCHCHSAAESDVSFCIQQLPPVAMLEVYFLAAT